MSGGGSPETPFRPPPFLTPLPSPPFRPQIFFALGAPPAGEAAIDAVLSQILSPPSPKPSYTHRRFEVLPRRLERVAGSVGGGSDFIVVGDAALSAHYRLGIGVNLAVMAAETLLPPLVAGGADIAAYEREASAVYERAELAMARFIKLESECNLVLFEDEAFRRDFETRTYEFIEEEDIERWCLSY